MPKVMLSILTLFVVLSLVGCGGNKPIKDGEITRPTIDFWSK